jgi:hypothetical protein
MSSVLSHDRRRGHAVRPLVAAGHHEHPPFSDGSMRSAYHVRSFEVHQLKQVWHCVQE